MCNASPPSASVSTCPAVDWRQRHQHGWPVLFNDNPLRIGMDVEDVDNSLHGQEGAAGPAGGQPSGPKPPLLRYLETIAQAGGCDAADVVAKLNDGSAAWAFKMFVGCATATTVVSGLCLTCLCPVWENIKQAGPSWCCRVTLV